MEKEGLPNAGLYDQRLLLEFVQKNIGQVGGNNSSVSVWGESAGASSILHHLVQNNGKTDPLFSKALLQSPAFEWQWDRTGVLNDTYTGFAQAVGCVTGDIACLRNFTLDDKALTNANTNYLYDMFASSGLFPVGPSLDGSLVSQLPAVSFYNAMFKHTSTFPSRAILTRFLGDYWTGSGLKSLVISHVVDEAKIFVPKKIKTDADFTSFVSAFMPQETLSSQRTAIATQYPASKSDSAFDRTKAVIQDSSFTCNTRQLFDAYHSSRPTYMMQYAVGRARNLSIHGTDLLPTFWNVDVNVAAWIETVAAAANVTISHGDAKIAAGVFAFPGLLAAKFQKYLVSHAVYGNPNIAPGHTVSWPAATPTSTAGATLVDKVLNVQPQKFLKFFNLISDTITSDEVCDFWKSMAAEVGPTPTADVQFRGGLRAQDQRDRATDL